MPQIMERHLITVGCRQLLEMFPDHLITLRNNEFILVFMRNCLDQLLKIFRKHELPRGLERLVDITDNIFAIQIQLAPSDRQHSVFQITELQTANFTHSQRKPHCQHTRKLNIRPANHVNDLCCSRKLLDFRLLRRKRDIQIKPNTVKLCCGDDQIFGVNNCFPSSDSCILIDRFLHIAAVQFVNINLHDTLQPVLPDDLITVNCGGGQDIPLHVNVFVHSLSDGDAALCRLHLLNIFIGHSLSFPACLRGI